MSIDDLVREYAGKVYNLAYRIIGNRHDAEDVTQETFLQVHRRMDSFRGESHIYTWIYRIAVNASLQFKRRLDRTYIDSLDETILQFQDDVPDEVRRWREDPATRHLYDELLEEVSRACYHFITFRLTDEQRVPYVMRFLLDISLDDIASVLRIDKNTVKARLNRAKQALGEYFNGRCQWTGEETTCSCESRLGFALSIAPEILVRLKNRPPSREMQLAVKTALAGTTDINEIYRRLPAEEYETTALRHYLQGA